MINRRSLLGLAAGAAVVAAFAGAQLTGGSVSTAVAGQKAAFEVAAFQAAQAAGKPILIDIRADWCSTCARQKPIISQLSGKPKFKDLVIFEVDYDRQKSIVRAPFKLWPKPVWFADHSNLHVLGRRMTHFEAHPNAMNLLRVALAGARG